jgi:hypothetical protein
MCYELWIMFKNELVNRLDLRKSSKEKIISLESFFFTREEM